MDKLNAKVKASRDDAYTSAQIVGMTGYNSTQDRMKVAHVSDSNEVLVTSTGAGPGVGHEVKCMGSEDGTPSGTQKQVHLDGNGNVLTSIVSSVNVLPADSVNSGITDDPANSVAVGLRARTDKALASSETFLLCDTQGHLQCDILNQNQEAQLAAFTNISDVASVKRLLCDSDGHLQVDIVSGGGGGTTNTAFSGSALIAAGQMDIIGEGSNAFIDTNGNTKGHIEVIVSGAGTTGDASVEWCEDTTFASGKVFIHNGYVGLSGLPLVAPQSLNANSLPDLTSSAVQAGFVFPILPARYARVQIDNPTAGDITYNVKTYLSSA